VTSGKPASVFVVQYVHSREDGVEDIRFSWPGYLPTLGEGNRLGDEVRTKILN
jgi:hypothetical protein